jgi:hypothetical protein
MQWPGGWISLTPPRAGPIQRPPHGGDPTIARDRAQLPLAIPSAALGFFSDLVS